MTEPAATPEEDLAPRGALASFDRWERQQWSIGDLDLDGDRDAWRELPGFVRAEVRGGVERFFLGETAVTETLAPLADAAPTAESRFYLCTQLADEARHSVFFIRWLQAVDDDEGVQSSRGDIGGYTRRHWDTAPDYFAGLLDQELRELTAAAQRDRRPEDWYRAITLYHLLVEGILGVTAQRTLLEAAKRFPGLRAFRAGLLNVARDESRHIRFGLGALREGIERGHGDAIAAQAVASVRGPVWVVIAPDRAVPALLPARARDAMAATSRRHLKLAHNALLGRLRRLGLEHHVAAVDEAWQAAVEGALDAYAERNGRVHPLRGARVEVA